MQTSGFLSDPNVRVSFLGKLPFIRTTSRHEPLVFRLSFLPFYVKHRCYCRAGVLRDGDNEYTPGLKKCQLLTVKKIIFFYSFFVFFYLFFRILFAFFFLRKTSTEENVRKRTDGAEGGTAGSALRGNYACAGMERCDPNGEQDGGRWKNCPDKKSPSVRRKGFSE